MHIGIFRLIRLFFANLFLQCSWSFYSTQSLGFLFNTLIGLDRNKHERLLHNYRIFFNTHPYVSGYIIGAVLRAYESDEDLADINRHIVVGQSAFASAGDTLFWQTMRPALLILAIILGIKCGVIGPLIFLIVYNIFHLYHRIRGFSLGYQQGWDVVYVLKEKQIKLTQRLFEIIGAFLVGFMPIVLQKSLNILFVLPFVGIFLLLLWKRIAPLLILTFVIILIIIMLILIK